MKLIIKSQINLKPTFKLQRKQSVALLYFYISVLFAKRQEINLKGGNDEPAGCSRMWHKRLNNTGKRDKY